MPLNGTDLKRHRAELGLTQRDMAQVLGLHVNSLARMERDEMAITETLSRFIRLLSHQAKGQSLKSLLRTLKGE